MENKKLKVFIIDDDLFYLEVLKQEFAKISNIKIYPYTSAEDCLDAFHLEPDMVILDFNLDPDNLGKMSGHDTLAKLEELNPNQKLVLISSEQNRELLSLYAKYRSVDCVTKGRVGNQVLKLKLQALQNEIICME